MDHNSAKVLLEPLPDDWVGMDAHEFGRPLSKFLNL
jgi:hypothetical protein